MKKFLIFDISVLFGYKDRFLLSLLHFEICESQGFELSIRELFIRLE